MSCNQLPLLQRLAVEDPAALRSPGWADHLDACPDCRQERKALGRSLAVFQQFESQPVPSAVAEPSWERLAQALAQERRQRSFWLPLALPLAAASLLVAVSSGVLMWPTAQAPAPPSPAKLIVLRPEQQVHLSDILRRSLRHAPAVAERELAHQTRRSEPAARPRFAPRGLEPRAVQSLAGFAERPTVDSTMGRAAGNGRGDTMGTAVRPAMVQASREPAQEVDGERPSIFGQTPTTAERAPVLLFRSLQRQRSRQAPLQVLPIFAPAHSGAGNLLPQALQSPRRIR